MNLADKPCYPINEIKRFGGDPYIAKEGGLTFRERLIIALAGNPAYYIKESSYEGQGLVYILQADAIIKQLEEEKK